MLVYTDTSVIGGCFDKEFKEPSLALFDEFKTGTKKLLLSDLVKMELGAANEQVNAKVNEVPARFKVEIKHTLKAGTLAAAYISQGAISDKCYNDALHIALATVHQADVLASWNFKHIVNLDRIKLYNFVNLQLGYRSLKIKTPSAILKTIQP
ncbi:type II toxin-antitoxin system VapC family toxin [Chitinophaga sp. G-6-1-13]|uniref:Type II toxin-antitoxin system VapC family toxin n=1 Tax=Chitinophaga fulva TaxID=2728842 RepID=A0A848GR22_9BACT|nr:PIN domain protein [Chitinophaga fulva]NML40427.1 type II toxin-antitoxin system VapC family toxin [Chitinophaga fulva]